MHPLDGSREASRGKAGKIIVLSVYSVVTHAAAPISSVQKGKRRPPESSIDQRPCRTDLEAGRSMTQAKQRQRERLLSHLERSWRSQERNSLHARRCRRRVPRLAGASGWCIGSHSAPEEPKQSKRARNIRIGETKQHTGRTRQKAGSAVQWRYERRRLLGAVALLVLFPASTRTGVIAPDFVRRLNRSRTRLTPKGNVGARLSGPFPVRARLANGTSGSGSAPRHKRCGRKFR